MYASLFAPLFLSGSVCISVFVSVFESVFVNIFVSVFVYLQYLYLPAGGCCQLLPIARHYSSFIQASIILYYSTILTSEKKSIRDIILQNSFRFERLVGSKSAIPLKEDNGAAAQSTQNHVTNLHFVILKEVSIGLFKIYQGHLKWPVNKIRVNINF